MQYTNEPIIEMKNDQDEELKLSKTHFDAIKLLEGALQKMDGIISLGILNLKLTKALLITFYLTIEVNLI